MFRLAACVPASLVILALGATPALAADHGRHHGHHHQQDLDRSLEVEDQQNLGPSFEVEDVQSHGVCFFGADPSQSGCRVTQSEPIDVPPVPPPTVFPHTPGAPQLKIVVPNAPIYICTSPTASLDTLDCSQPFQNQTVHLGDVMDYQTVITDVNGVKYWMVGPWNPFGMIPFADAQAIS